jgi:tetratricopeptide (TPR) repeat protein
MKKKHGLNLIVWIQAILLFVVPACLRGQSPQRPNDNASLTVSLSVQVRTQSGSLLDTPAVVTLCTFSGIPMTSETTIGAQAVFSGLNGGSYVVRVQADGYELASVQADLTQTKMTQVLIVKLKPDSSSGASNSGPGGIVLAPRVQKEINAGHDAIRSGELDEAVKHLESAHQMAPNSADIAYLLGVVYEKKNDPASARRFWDQALQSDPKHVPTLLAYGNLLLREKHAEEARKYSQSAVEDAPDSWQAHNLLALTLLSQHSTEAAIAEAELAVKLGKGEAAASLLTLGQALAANHQNERAVAELEAFLVQQPTGPQAQAVRELISRLRNSPDAAPTSGTGAPSPQR